MIGLFKIVHSQSVNNKASPRSGLGMSSTINRRIADRNSRMRKKFPEYDVPEHTRQGSYIHGTVHRQGF